MAVFQFPDMYKWLHCRHALIDCFSPQPISPLSPAAISRLVIMQPDVIHPTDSPVEGERCFYYTL